jgi:hypothetical protein
MQQLQDPLIHSEHDRGAGNCPQKVRRETSVQGGNAFLFPDQPETLDKAGIFGMAAFGGCLTKSSADDLYMS